MEQFRLDEARARAWRRLTAPLPFFFPAYRGVGWPRWQLQMGVKLYGLLC